MSFNMTDLMECEQTEVWDRLYSMQPVFMAVICALGLLGNAFVLCVFYLHRCTCTVADIYLGNLAAADFLMLCCLPFWVVTVTRKFNWLFGEPMCRLVSVVIAMNYNCSIMFLSLVSLDRYLVLTRPVSVARFRAVCRAKLVCLFIWVAAFLLSLPALLFRSVKFFPEFEAEACFMEYPHAGWSLRYNMTASVMGFLIPVPLLSFCSNRIIAVLKDKRVRRSSSLRSEQRAALLVLVVLAVFVLCWLPYHVFILLDTLYYFGVVCGCLWINGLDIGNQLSTYIGYSNSSLNPFLYVIVGRHFRQRAKSAFMRTVRSKKRNVSPAMINSNDQSSPDSDYKNLWWFLSPSAGRCFSLHVHVRRLCL